MARGEIDTSTPHDALFKAPAMLTYAQKLREEGREDQLRVSLVDVLEARGFALTQVQRARIESCNSLATLHRWYAAAKTAAMHETVDAILDDATTED